MPLKLDGRDTHDRESAKRGIVEHYVEHATVEIDVEVKGDEGERQRGNGRGPNESEKDGRDNGPNDRLETRLIDLVVSLSDPRQLRRHPLLRALRPDKVTLAALQSTLDDWLTGRAVPCLKMIHTSQEELRQVVQGWLNALPTGVRASIEEVEGAIGGGTVPGRSWPSIALAIESPSPVCLREHLLAGEPAVVARISHDRLLLDARTVAPVGQAGALLERLLEAISAVGDTGS